MRLSRLRRLSSQVGGFFPDVSAKKVIVDAMKNTSMNQHLREMDGFQQVSSSLCLPQQQPSLFPKIIWGSNLCRRPPLFNLRQHLWMRFHKDRPKYPKTIKGVEPFTLAKLQKGMDLDAHSILYIFPSDFICQSKYIMVCCFLVPLLHESEEGRDTKYLISVTSELRDRYGSDFEMVVVAKMRQGWLNHKPSFDHFFSEFPPFCKVIPFSNLNTRNHICKLLGLYYSHPKYLLLERCSSDPSRETYKVLELGGIGFFKSNGADNFPYSEDISRAIHEQFIRYPSQLDNILGRKSSDIRVSRFPPSSDGSGGESVSLSELEGKVVGLYLCFDGSLMLKLDQVSRDCKERGLEFEVVLLYMPFHFLCNVNTLIETMNDVLYKLCNTRSWWIMPYIDSISRRLWRRSPSCTYDGEIDDRLIIVGPHGKYVDPYAGAFLRRYGIDVYPFTCDRLIEWKLEKVRSVTLESLLVHGSRDFVFGKDSNGCLQKVPVKQLQGRVILVCFDCGWTKDTSAWTYGLLAEYYGQIKSAHPSFEAVVVRMFKKSVNEKLNNNVDASELPPWLVCPLQPDHRDYVYDMLRMDFPSVVAFGDDGRVCSFKADDLLVNMGVDAFPFKGDLREDVISALAYDNDSWTIPELGIVGSY